MNQNNLSDLENLANLKYRSSVLMLNQDGIFDVVFSDVDNKRVKNLESRLKELEYETVVHSEVFWNGCWTREINITTIVEEARINNSFLVQQ